MAKGNRGASAAVPSCSLVPPAVRLRVAWRPEPGLEGSSGVVQINIWNVPEPNPFMIPLTRDDAASPSNIQWANPVCIPQHPTRVVHNNGS
jgi:hypothetical protein